MKNKPSVQIKTVGEEALQQRLDNYLLKHLKGVPKSHIYQIIRKGQVRINGKRAKAESKLQLEDKVRIPPVRVATSDKPIKPNFQACEAVRKAIIFDHEDFLVINKPAGFAVHGGTHVSYGIIDVLRHLKPKVNYELVHRLDKLTSGCLLIAKNRLALTLLQNAWHDEVQKYYLAIIKAYLPQPTLDVKAPLLRLQHKVVVDKAQGKAAHSTFTEIERYDYSSLVRVTLHTGRMHQIRVHAQAIEHPILGDDKYGDHEFNKQNNAKGLFLHAHCLQFNYQGQAIKVEAPWVRK